MHNHATCRSVTFGFFSSRYGYVRLRICDAEIHAIESQLFHSGKSARRTVWHFPAGITVRARFARSESKRVCKDFSCALIFAMSSVACIRIVILLSFLFFMNIYISSLFYLIIFFYSDEYLYPFISFIERAPNIFKVITYGLKLKEPISILTV